MFSNEFQGCNEFALSPSILSPMSPLDIQMSNPYDFVEHNYDSDIFNFGNEKLLQKDFLKNEIQPTMPKVVSPEFSQPKVVMTPVSVEVLKLEDSTNKTTDGIPDFSSLLPSSNESGKSWTTVQSSDLFKNCSLSLNGRREPKKTKVEKKLYQSIKYDLSVDLEFHRGVHPKYVILKVWMLFSDQMVEARNVGRGRLIDVVSDPLTVALNGKASGTAKLSFLDSSYHHARRSFVLVVDFVAAKTSEILARVISSSFSVFARKAQKSKSKRKRVEKKMPNKRRKIKKNKKSPEDSFCLFKKKLADMTNFAASGALTEEEKKICLDMIQKQLMPNLF